MRSVGDGRMRVVRQFQTEERRGEMNLTDTVDLVTELGLMAEEEEAGLEKRAEGRVGGGTGGNLEEEVEVVVGDLVL